jgi:hypothetical protein
LWKTSFHLVCFFPVSSSPFSSENSQSRAQQADNSRFEVVKPVFLLTLFHDQMLVHIQRELVHKPVLRSPNRQRFPTA